VDENINSILSGSGASNLEGSNVRHIASADWDGDGLPDLALANETTIEFWRNLSQETGGWQPCISVVAFIGAEHISDLAFVDGNRDGRTDLVVGISGREDQVWANAYDPEVGCQKSSHSQFFQLDYDETFPPDLPLETTNISAADFDNDGWIDLAVGVWGSPSYLLRNRGNSYVDTRFEPPIQIEVGSLNNVRDLAWGLYLNQASEVANRELAIAHDEGLSVYSPAAQAMVWEFSVGKQDHASLVAWGDLSGDGRQDLSSVLYQEDAGSYLSVFYATQGLSGGGPETPDVSVPLSVQPLGLALADDNLDGMLDTVVVSQFGDAQILFGTEEGPVLDDIWSPTSEGASDLVWLDAGGDGALDLLVSDQAYGEIAWELSSARDGPIEHIPFPPESPTQFYYSLAVADYDRDGDLDLAVGSEEGCIDDCNSIWINDWNGDPGNEPFRPVQDLGQGIIRSLAFADINADGYVDLIAGYDDFSSSSNGAPQKVFINEGPPSYNLNVTNVWTDSLSETPDDTRSIALGDFDGDGDLDLAVGNESGSYDSVDPATYSRARNRLWRNNLDHVNGIAGFTQIWEEDVTASSPPSWTNQVSWGDWDNDGVLELAVANGRWNGTQEASGVYSVVFSSTGAFENLTFSPIGSPARGYSLAWGDANGDGYQDLAAGRWGDVNKVFFNPYADGSPNWQEQVLDLGSSQRSTMLMVWGDFDADGRLDLAEANYDDSNRIWLNKSTAAFGRTNPNLTFVESPFRTSDQQVEAGLNSKKIAFIDFDNDGDLDVVDVNTGSETGGRVLINEQRTGPRLPNNPSSAEPRLPNNPSHGLVGRPTLLIEEEDLGGIAGHKCLAAADLAAPLFAGPGTTNIAESCRIFRRLTPVVTVPIKLFDAEEDPASVRLEYSLHGGGAWEEATVEGYLDEMKTDPDGVSHDLSWLIGVDPVHGDQVRLRLVVNQKTRSIGSTVAFAAQNSVSAPFRVHSGCSDILSPDEDGDGDGYPCINDCDDDPTTGSDIHPGPDTDSTDDLIDSNCDGFLRLCLLDRDSDGWGDEEGSTIPSADLACDGLNETLCGAANEVLLAGETSNCDSGFDCDDYDESVHPGSGEEIAGDGIDHDCDGLDPAPGDDDDDSSAPGDDDDDSLADDDDSLADDDDSLADDDDSEAELFVQPPGCELDCSFSHERSAVRPLAYVLTLFLLLGLRRRRRTGSRHDRGLPALLAGLLVVALPLAASAQDAPSAANKESDPTSATMAQENKRAAAEVAIEALSVHDEHCARMVGDRLENADALVAVAPVWKRVTQVYQRSGASYLLYWSGTLALCLGQQTNAGDDLEAFLKEEGDSPEYVELVRDARRRLRRLGRSPARARAMAKLPVPGVGKIRDAAKSRTLREKWGPPWMIGFGGGTQILLSPTDNEAHRFFYGAIAIDVSWRVLGPLRVVASTRPAISTPARNELGDENGIHSLLWSFGVGADLQFGKKLRPRIGGSFQFAPNPSGDVGGPVLVGGVFALGLDIPFGKSPLSLRAGGEVGGMSTGFLLARALLELVVSP